MVQTNQTVRRFYLFFGRFRYMLELIRTGDRRWTVDSSARGRSCGELDRRRARPVRREDARHQEKRALVVVVKRRSIDKKRLLANYSSTNFVPEGAFLHFRVTNCALTVGRYHT